MNKMGITIGVVDDAGFGFGRRGLFGKEAYAELLARINEGLLGNKVVRILLGGRSSGNVVGTRGSGIPVVRALYDKSVYVSLSSLIDEHNIELLHLNILNPRYVWPLSNLHRRRRIPFVLTMHSWYYLCPTGWKIKHPEMTICKKRAVNLHCLKCIFSMNRTYRLPLGRLSKGLFQAVMLQKLMYISDALISPSRIFKEHVRAELNIDSYYVPNPVDPSLMGESSGNWEDEGYAFFIGRLEYEKGAHLLPRIAERIKPIELHVAGTGRLSRLLKDAESKISNLYFHGYVDENEKRRLLKSSRVVLVPSIWMEMFGFVVVEAFLHSKPVVAFKGLGGPSELVEASGGGVVVEPYDLDALSRAVRRLAEDPGTSGRLGFRARRWVERELNPVVISKRLGNIYKAVLVPQGSG